VEQSARTETYEAVAVRVHADTTLVASDAPNMSSGDGQGLSAPATVVFTAHANNPVAALYRWTIYRKGEEESGDKLIRTGEEVEHTFTRAGEYVAELEVTNRTAVCTDVSQSFTLQISETVLEAPNAFSPGSTPGVNDEFRVVFKSVNKFRGWIFNRWGTEMFRWDNPAVGWDGKKGGRFVPPGVYFYVIEYEDSLGKPRKKTGNINILRSKTIQNEVTEE
jgi:gliding motility-associated-like protein